MHVSSKAFLKHFSCFYSQRRKIKVLSYEECNVLNRGLSMNRAVQYSRKAPSKTIQSNLTTPGTTRSSSIPLRALSKRLLSTDNHRASIIRLGKTFQFLTELSQETSPVPSLILSWHSFVPFPPCH